jgi:tRNA nucleotidyltransferase (CCA-adding enzyme)
MAIKFYQVGGSVRDEILGVKSKDIDYAVEAPSFDSMRDAIIKRGGKIFLETPKYFTIRAHVPELGATDYTLCRKDGEYIDGRHPENVTVGTIHDDLARRDFTMNAIAKDADTGEIMDPFNGRDDLANKLIRCVGDAQTRFTEDKLRIFRAVRFAVCKEMQIEKETEKYVSKMGHKYEGNFDGVSTERIREELMKMFSHDSYDAFYHLFDRFKGLGEIVRDRGIWFKPTIESK